MTTLKSVRVMKSGMPIVFYRKDHAVHAKAVVLRGPRRKTQLAGLAQRRNGTRIPTKKGKGVKGRSNIIPFDLLLITYMEMLKLDRDRLGCGAVATALDRLRYVAT